MKNIKHFLLLAVLTVIPSVMFGEKFNRLEYTLNASDHTATVGDNSSITDVYVNIPATVTGSDGTEYTVTAIAARAFYGNSSLETIVIPETVKIIGNRAFYSCGSLSAFYILSPDATIASDAFKNCMCLNTIHTVENNSYTQSDFGMTPTWQYRNIVTGSYGFDDNGNIVMRKALAEFKDGTPFKETTPYVADVATYTRSNIKANQWYTLCLPFDCDVPQGVIAEAFQSRDGSKIVYSKVDKIAAGVPYIFKSETGNSVTFSATNALIKSYKDIEHTESNYEFVGVLSSVWAPNENDGNRFMDVKNYIFYGLNSDANAFQRVGLNTEGNNARCDPYHAFIRIKISGSSPSALKVIHGGGDGTTAIGNIETEGKAGQTTIYNLNGQRIAAPQKGINIINGKKVIIK